MHHELLGWISERERERGGSSRCHPVLERLGLEIGITSQKGDPRGLLGNPLGPSVFPFVMEDSFTDFSCTLSSTDDGKVR